MALPFVLWGAAALLAGTGVVKGIGAVSDFDDAKSIGESARRRYEDAETSLQKSRDKTNSKFKELSEVKVSIFKNQINHLVTAIKKSKHASSKLNDFNVSISADELKEMEQSVDRSGMAGGMLALGGIFLSSTLVGIGGFMLASKAEEALTQAHEYQAEVDIAIAEMKKMKVVLTALQANAKEVNNALSQMAKRFDAIKVNDDSNSEAFNQMMIVGKGLKNLLDIAIMEQDGGASKNIKSKVSGYLEI
jgi:hypothetical protein